jgi:hypothetical protein
MKPIELKILRSTKKNPQHYFAYQPPFRFEVNDLLDKDGYIVAQFKDNEYFKMDGKAYNLAEALAEGLNLLQNRKNCDVYKTTEERKKAYAEYRSYMICSNANPFIAQDEMLTYADWLCSKVSEV